MKLHKAGYRLLAPLGLLVTLSLVPCGESLGSVPLFNGTDLSGWTKLGGDATYHVEGDEIVGTSAQPSSPNTFLVTDQSYADFVLDVDFFISDTDFNSGVQIRSQSLPTHNDGRVFGYQVEIDPSTRAWTGGIYFEGGSPDRPAVWLDDLDDNPAAQAAFVLGDWNRFHIIAQDRRIQTWINDVPAADYTDDDPDAFLPSGFIGLQVHQVTSNDPREARWRNLVLSSLPTLVVNRETGDVLLRNDMDAAVEFESYSIGSPSGSLNAANGGWQSLSDQAEPGWSETAANSQLLAEGTGGSPFSLVNGASRSLGKAYVPVPVAFGVDAEDLAFQFSETGFGPLSGPTEYVGQNVANNLVLFVDPVTGQGVLKNTSPFPVAITGYSILSDSESLVGENWQSLADRGLTGWDETPPEAFALSELNPEDELLLDSGDRYNLGRIYDPLTGTEDLQLEFLVAGEEDDSAGAVLFRLAADFNLDQVVDHLDLQRWQAAYGMDGAADADGDSDTDGDDFLVWQRQVGLSTGQFAAARTVPEPATCLVAILGAATCFHPRERCVAGNNSPIGHKSIPSTHRASSLPYEPVELKERFDASI